MDCISLPAPGPERNRIGRPGKSAQILATEWPALNRACHQTYWPGPSFGRVDQENRCPAGYVLAAALAMEVLANDRHAQLHLTRADLDQAAAHELYFHWNRGRKFARAEAAIFVCLQRLVIERPEKLRKAVRS